ncbi:hypothetical protein [Microbacterium sp.]|uniref:hypothetical protein n=1 Tax=Microbacterium sp. TaxID=51671 RepID=UPI003F982D4D
MHDADELAALRARAYGRHADISDDPAALHRLRELEEQAAEVREGGAGHGAGTALSSGSRTSDAHDSAADDVTGRSDRPDALLSVAADGSAGFATTAAGPADAERTRAPDETETGSRIRIRGEASDARPENIAAGPADHAVEPADDAQAEPRPFTRRLAALWAASVVVASVITGIVVATIVDYDPTVVATLHEAPHLDFPENFENAPLGDPADAVRFEDYLGLTLVGFEMNAGATGGSAESNDAVPTPRCITIFGGDGSDSLGASGFTTGGCSDGVFDPIAEVTVSADFPEELQSVHEIGTTLRFAQDGDRVVVRAGSPD